MKHLCIAFCACSHTYTHTHTGRGLTTLAPYCSRPDTQLVGDFCAACSVTPSLCVCVCVWHWRRLLVLQPKDVHKRILFTIILSTYTLNTILISMSVNLCHTLTSHTNMHIYIHTYILLYYLCMYVGTLVYAIRHFFLTLFFFIGFSFHIYFCDFFFVFVVSFY